jgi:hypothetical protein
MKQLRVTVVGGTFAVCLAINALIGNQALADFVFGEPMKVLNINTASNDGAVRVTQDGLELYFSSNREQGGNLCGTDIWVSTRRSVSDPWGTPVKLDAPINTDVVETYPCPSADGLELYFTDGWTGADGWTAHYHSCPRRPHGLGGADLWVATRVSREDPWGEPVNLGESVNTHYDDDQPCLSEDGLSLYFASNRPGGAGNSDIYVATRATKKDPWSKPTLLSSKININWKWETHPFVSPDERSLFFSQGGSTVDIFVTHRAAKTDPWKIPESFYPVNTLPNVKYGLSYSQADSTIYFSRGNGIMNLASFDIWQLEVTPIVDFNGDSMVDILDALALLEHWQTTEISLYDIAPLPFGDGVVDAKDLQTLAKHMVKP